jgi:hypothetical protein
MCPREAAALASIAELRPTYMHYHHSEMKSPARRLALVAVAFVLPVIAAGVEPSLGRRGTLLLEESFDGTALPKGWAKNTGELSVKEGVLHASELPAQSHVGAFRKALPLQDAVVQLDFKFEGATTLHLGFDPAPGQLKKQGHLFSVIITENAWTLTEHNDKADPASKNVVHAKATASFPRGQWFTLSLEMKGNDVVARIEGKEPLRATAKDFHVKKPGLVFRAGGKAGQEVLIDNVKVWELK